MKNKPNNYPNSTRIKLSPIAINKPVKAKRNQWRRFERFDSLGEMPDEWWAKLQKRYEEAGQNCHSFQDALLDKYGITIRNAP